VKEFVDEALREEFAVECLEHLDAVESELLSFSGPDSGRSAEAVDYLSSLRESPEGVADDGFAELAATAAEVLRSVGGGGAEFTAELTGALLDTVDALRQILWDRAGSPNVAAQQRRLRQILDGESADDQSSPIDAGTIRSLVVEDEFTSRIILQDYLRRLGDCHVAVNGQEAVEACNLALASGCPYDLICMDIHMPGMDGQEAVASIRQLEEAHGLRSSKGARIVMTTADRDVKSVFRAFHSLCDAYLFKPIDIRQLQRHLKALGLPA
jgi:two-component system chemotaxis response regulator CheY